MKLVPVACAAAGVATVAVLAGVGIPEGAHGESTAAAAKRSITVSGSGSIETVPDRAQFSFGVVTKGLTATQALGANSAAVSRVIAALKGAGVAAADIQTQSVSLVPQTSPNGTEIVGYTATNTVGATFRDLGRAGAIVDAAVGAGADAVSGPALTASDVTALYRRALRAAVTDARGKAKGLAAAAGARLGVARTIAETSFSQPLPIEAKARAADAGVPIEPGTQLVQASVTVEFAVG